MDPGYYYNTCVRQSTQMSKNRAMQHPKVTMRAENGGAEKKIVPRSPPTWLKNPENLEVASSLILGVWGGPKQVWAVQE